MSELASLRSPGECVGFFLAVHARARRAQTTWREGHLHTRSLCSGIVWQPLLNLFAEVLDLSFAWCFVLVGLFGGCFFFAGLRAARFANVADPAELGWDASLSFAVAGAQAFFVATTPSFSKPSDPFLEFAVRTHDDWLVGSALAGTTTMLGFLTAGSLLNLLAPEGTIWSDPPPPPKPAKPPLAGFSSKPTYGGPGPLSDGADLPLVPTSDGV